MAINTINTQTSEDLFYENKHLAEVTLYKALGQPHAIAQSNSIEFDDLLQVAYISLWKACQSYNSEKSKFQTHAISNIRWGLIYFLKNECNTIKYPKNRVPVSQDRFKLVSMEKPVGEQGTNSKTMHDVIIDQTDGYNVEGNALHNMDIKDINKAMQSLTHGQKNVVNMKLIELTEQEIGDRLGISKQAVNKRFAQAVNKMSKFLV